MDADNYDSKEAAGRQARVIALMLNVDYSLMVDEAWSVSGRDLPRAEAILEEFGALANYPGRVEVAFFMLETRYGTWGGQSELKPKGASKKRRTFGAVTFTRADDSSSGLLANIIQKDADAVQAGLQSPLRAGSKTRLTTRASRRFRAP